MPRRRSAGGRGALCGRAADLAVTAGPLWAFCGTPVGPGRCQISGVNQRDFGQQIRTNSAQNSAFFFGNPWLMQKKVELTPDLSPKKPGQRWICRSDSPPGTRMGRPPRRSLGRRCGTRMDSTSQSWELILGAEAKLPGGAKGRP